MELNKFIRDVYDYPKKGIVFKDITPLLLDEKATKKALDRLVELLQGEKIDKVVAMESRGFLFGMLLAQRLEAGFVPVRKPNKLPWEKISQSYELEYGTDTLEIHKDAILPNEKVLIHDDILATGGTSQAACHLVEKLQGKIQQVNFLIELSFLKGREKLKDYNVASVLKY